MDNLFFYKKDTNLKDNVSKIRFSYTREYRLIFSNDSNQLKRNLEKYEDGLLFYMTNLLTKEDRVSITNISQILPELKICLCSHISHANDAWKLNLFHFLDHPISNIGLSEVYKKYLNGLIKFDHDLKLMTKEGLVKIPFRLINYLKANGNYTRIYLRGGKFLMETKQLQKYEYFTECDLRMKRLHRSYIFNIRNIKSVGKNEVHFYKTEHALKLSLTLCKNIKSALLSN